MKKDLSILYMGVVKGFNFDQWGLAEECMEDW